MSLNHFQVFALAAQTRGQTTNTEVKSLPH